MRSRIPALVLSCVALVYSCLCLLANSGNAGLREDILAKAGFVAPETVEQAARLLMIQQDPAGRRVAARLHQRLLSQNPASVYQWIKCAYAFAAAGDNGKAEYAVSAARKLGPALAPAQMEAVHFYVGEGALDAVLETGRHVMELVPQYDGFLFRYYQQLGVTPEVILLRGVPANARAMSSFLTFSIETKDVGQAELAWRKMTDLGLRTEKTLGAYTGFLVAANQPGEAWSAWHDYYKPTVPPEEDPQGVFNPGFEREPVDGPFDWHWTEVRGAETSITSAQAWRGHRSLWISFSGERNVAYSHLSQSLVAGPGQYELKAHIKSEGITTNQGVALELVESGHVIAASEPLTGTSDWHPVVIPFRLTGSRWLSLRVVRHPSSKFDNKIAGSFWMDEVLLERVQP